MIEYSEASWPMCLECGEEYNPKRKQLGYTTCLKCGDKEAQKSIEHKRKCSAPLYNKGAYQYVGSHNDAKWIGR